MKNFILIAVMAIFFAGCSSIENSNAISTERQLAAAGFQMQLADTPARLEHVKTLEQRKLLPSRKDGNLVYVYADATSCKCIYAGSEVDYQRYQRISLRQEAANQNRMAAADISMAQQNAAMNWGLWGGWQRPFYD